MMATLPTHGGMVPAFLRYSLSWPLANQSSVALDRHRTNGRLLLQPPHLARLERAKISCMSSISLVSHFPLLLGSLTGRFSRILGPERASVPEDQIMEGIGMLKLGGHVGPAADNLAPKAGLSHALLDSESLGQMPTLQASSH